MKRIIYTLLVAFAVSNFQLSAQNIDLSNQLIHDYNTAQQKATSRSATLHDHLWLTPLLLKARLNWNDLTDDAKTLFRNYLSRPTFSGTEQTYSRGNFKFHYTTNGPSGESVSSTDTNPANGVPDYIDQMASKFVDDVYETYHTTDGLPVPPPDNGAGGNNLFDVYVSGSVAGYGVYGYCSPEYLIGNNPNSPTTEYKAANGYMVMRNNYNGFGNTNIALSVTAAHEYMHAIQFGIHAYMATWMMEGTAVWGEDHVYPGYDDNLQYLMSIFSTPDVALNLHSNEDGGAYSGHWYGAWLFFKYLSEHIDNAIIKQIYIKNINNSNNDVTMAAINTALTQRGTNLKDMYKGFVIANAIMSSNSAYAPYTYARANVYNSYINPRGGLKYENRTSPFNYTGTNRSWNSQSNGNNRLMRMGADYFKMTASANFKITASNTNTENIFVLVKKKNSPAGMSVVEANANGEINVGDVSNWDSYIPIIIRFDQNVTNTAAHNYILNITAGTQGIEEYQNKIAMYPNPANDYFTVQLKDNFEAQINVMDATGKLLYTKQASEGNNVIATNKWQNGIYFVSMIKNNQVVKTTRIIVSH